MKQLQNIGIIIVAAGRGSRMEKEGFTPKQYQNLCGKSIIQNSINGFLEHPLVNVVQVVICAQDHEFYECSVAKHPKLCAPVIGGTTRQKSVLAGLEALSTHGIDRVLIHDSVRPFLNDRLLDALISATRPGLAILPVLPVVDTLRHFDAQSGESKTVCRNGLYRSQTPQGFMFHEILAAHRKVAKTNHCDFTDDVAIAEWCGIRVQKIVGSEDNMKITTIEDLNQARRKQAENVPDVRTGTGYDVHRFEMGDCVTLCGVSIPHTAALQGHSDADVGLHAIIDAILGAIGSGDIGYHFPPSNSQWKDANSSRFLEHAIKLVQRAGGILTHMDVTIICEVPKIAPHRGEMRIRIAEITGIESGRISVKATTSEGMGFVGRGEGIAAQANATVVFPHRDKIQ